MPCRRSLRSGGSSRGARRVWHMPPTSKLRTESIVQNLQAWDVERRHDGAVLVRVHSRVIDGRALPDAVFAFRAGDPQFVFWEQQLQHRQVAPPGSQSMPVSQTMPMSQ